MEKKDERDPYYNLIDWYYYFYIINIIYNIIILMIGLATT